MNGAAATQPLRPMAGEMIVAATQPLRPMAGEMLVAATQPLRPMAGEMLLRYFARADGVGTRLRLDAALRARVRRQRLPGTARPRWTDGFAATAASQRRRAGNSSMEMPAHKWE